MGSEVLRLSLAFALVGLFAACSRSEREPSPPPLSSSPSLAPSAPALASGAASNGASAPSHAAEGSPLRVVNRETGSAGTCGGYVGDLVGPGKETLRYCAPHCEDRAIPTACGKYFADTCKARGGCGGASGSAGQQNCKARFAGHATGPLKAGACRDVGSATASACPRGSRTCECDVEIDGPPAAIQCSCGCTGEPASPL